MGPDDYESSAELRAVERPDRGADDYESSAELRAVERPDRGAGGPHDSALDAADARAEL